MTEGLLLFFLGVPLASTLVMAIYVWRDRRTPLPGLTSARRWNEMTEHVAEPGTSLHPIKHRCTRCRGVGWVLECNDIGKPGPRQLELLPCIEPICTVSGQDLMGLTVNEAHFQHITRHPAENYVMRVYGTPEVTERFRDLEQAGQRAQHEDEDLPIPEIFAEGASFFIGRKVTGVIANDQGVRLTLDGEHEVWITEPAG